MRTSEVITVRLADTLDVPACKRIADAYRDVFGFLTRGIFLEAAAGGKLLVAVTEDGSVRGFVRFNHRRRDRTTVLYDIAADPARQRGGIGRSLVAALIRAAEAQSRADIVLRCPEGAAANQFYQALGFRAVGIEQGRRRKLILWRLVLESRTILPIAVSQT
jgi:ribosomal protein S18 acetylase RimI-like enzyme